MRTTLKRGLGQGAAANGNGRAVLPPAVATPMRRYRQPVEPRSRWSVAGRILLWIGALVLMVLLSLAGGIYLFVEQSVSAARPQSRSAKEATARLDAVPPPDKPAIALVIGYDRRWGERGLPSRSDTVMLLRADPGKKAISMLSFPRDLMVEVRCPGRASFVGRINSAYSECEAKGTLETVRHLTGLPINYLITVNFRAFRQVVDRLGGVWVDVDRRYYNKNVGTSETNFANIDLQPGYQRLSGSEALDFVRYRHTDSDLYRNARQQLFVRAMKEQLSSSFSAFDLPGVINSIVHNVEIGQGGGSVVSPKKVFSYARFAYELPAGHVFQVKIPNLYGINELYAPEGAIQEAVADFSSPDVEASNRAASVAGIRRPRPRARAPRPGQTTVTVLNGNDVPGAAGNASYLLGQRGYRTLVPPNNLPANAPRTYFRTQIFFDPAQQGAEAAARQLKNVFGSAEVKRGVPGELAPLSSGAMNVVAVGQTFHGRLAPAPSDKTPERRPARVTRNVAATLPLLREAQRQVPFRLMLPTLLERSSFVDSEMPKRVYRTGNHKAVRLTFRLGNEVAGYWAIHQTDWDDAPVLKGKSFRHEWRGRTYDYYWSGSHLHMVVLRENGASYWVVNTLLDSLSNETMIAIARGLRPLPR